MSNGNMNRISLVSGHIFCVHFFLFYFSYWSYRCPLYKMMLILCLLMCLANIFFESGSLTFTYVPLFLKYTFKYIAQNSL